MIVNCCHVEIVAFLKLILPPAAMVNPFISSSSFSAILKDVLHRNHVICKLGHSWYQWFVFFSLSIWLRNLSAYSLSKNEILVWIFSVVLLFSISPNLVFIISFLLLALGSFCFLKVGEKNQKKNMSWYENISDNFIVAMNEILLKHSSVCSFMLSPDAITLWAKLNSCHTQTYDSPSLMYLLSFPSQKKSAKPWSK